LCILAVLIAGICFQKKKKNLARNLWTDFHGFRLRAFLNYGSGINIINKVT
jgi:hypothetical protein